MISETFLSFLNSALRSKLNNFTKYNPQLRSNSIALINEFLLYIDQNRGRIYNLVTGSKKEKSFLKSNGEIEIELLLNPNGNSRLRISLLQSEVESISIEKIRKYIEAKTGYVYLLHSQFGSKIGMSTNLNNRNKTFDVKLPFPVEMKYYVRSKNFKIHERDIHELLSDCRLNGEWFALNISAAKKVILFCRDNSLIIERYNHG